MVLAITLIFLSAILFVIAGLCFVLLPPKGPVALIFILVGVLVIMGGTKILYISGTGNVCEPLNMPNQIYKLSGQVTTSGGIVAIVEDSEQNVYALWAGDKPALSLNTKFVKIGNGCLVSVDVPATTTLPTPAKKPTEPPATQ